MVYITKSKAHDLLHNVRKGEIDGLNPNDLYSVSLDILSKHERLWLAKARELFRDFDFFMDKIYQGRGATEDTFTLIHEGRSACFHDDIQCSVLHSDYRNATIPEEIKKRGNDAVIKFRKWFAENEKLSVSNGEHFIAKMKMDFFITDPNLKFYETQNSGVEEFDNEDLSNIEERIDDLISKVSIFYSSCSSYQQEVILNYGDRGNISLPNRVDNQTLEHWLGFKGSLKKMMLMYFRVKFNPDLSFSFTLLEQLGFRKCQKCAVNLKLDDTLPF